MHELTPELRALGEGILAAALERLAADPPELGRTAAPAEVAALAGASVTAEGLGPEEALRRFRDVLLPLTIAIDHPRYLAFIPSAPTPASAFVELLLSAGSVYAGTWLEGAGAVHAENEALRWLADLAGLPAGAGGCFVQGGTNGNLSALHAAREHARHRRTGPRPSAGWSPAARRCTRPCARRRALMDVGVLPVAADEHGRMHGEALREALAGADGRVRGGRHRRHHQRRAARRSGRRGRGLPRARRLAARRRRLRRRRAVRAERPRRATRGSSTRTR